MIRQITKYYKSTKMRLKKQERLFSAHDLKCFDMSGGYCILQSISLVVH